MQRAEDVDKCHSQNFAVQGVTTRQAGLWTPKGAVRLDRRSTRKVSELRLRSTTLRCRPIKNPPPSPKPWSGMTDSSGSRQPKMRWHPSVMPVPGPWPHYHQDVRPSAVSG